MAELHLVGAIKSASFLPSSAAAAFCRFRFVAGNGWTLLDGHAGGQSQTAQVDRSLGGGGVIASFTGEAYAPAAGSASCVWEQPVDVHFSASTLTGWPQLAVTVWAQTELQQNEIIGYGVVRVPVAPGEHTLEIATWRPEGSFLQELRASFLGAGVPSLTDTTMVFDPAAGSRHAIASVTSATVTVELQVLQRGFAERGIATSA